MAPVSKRRKVSGTKSSAKVSEDVLAPGLTTPTKASRTNKNGITIEGAEIEVAGAATMDRIMSKNHPDTKTETQDTASDAHGSRRAAPTKISSLKKPTSTYAPPAFRNLSPRIVPKLVPAKPSPIELVDDLQDEYLPPTPTELDPTVKADRPRGLASSSSPGNRRKFKGTNGTQLASSPLKPRIEALESIASYDEEQELTASGTEEAQSAEDEQAVIEQDNVLGAHDVPNDIDVDDAEAASNDPVAALNAAAGHEPKATTTARRGKTPQKSASKSKPRSKSRYIPTAPVEDEDEAVGEEVIEGPEEPAELQDESMVGAATKTEEDLVDVEKHIQLVELESQLTALKEEVDQLSALALSMTSTDANGVREFFEDNTPRLLDTIQSLGPEHKIIDSSFDTSTFYDQHVAYLNHLAPSQLDINHTISLRNIRDQDKLFLVTSVRASSPWPEDLLAHRFFTTIDLATNRIEKIGTTFRETKHVLLSRELRFDELDDWIGERLRSELHKTDLAGIITGIGRYFDTAIQKARIMAALEDKYIAVSAVSSSEDQVPTTEPNSADPIASTFPAPTDTYRGASRPDFTAPLNPSLTALLTPYMRSSTLTLLATDPNSTKSLLLSCSIRLSTTSSPSMAWSLATSGAAITERTAAMVVSLFQKALAKTGVASAVELVWVVLKMDEVVPQPEPVPKTAENDESSKEAHSAKKPVSRSIAKGRRRSDRGTTSGDGLNEDRTDAREDTKTGSEVTQTDYNGLKAIGNGVNENALGYVEATSTETVTQPVLDTTKIDITMQNIADTDDVIIRQDEIIETF